jgi:hypothetical protein
MSRLKDGLSGINSDKLEVSIRKVVFSLDTAGRNGLEDPVSYTDDGGLDSYDGLVGSVKLIPDVHREGIFSPQDLKMMTLGADILTLALVDYAEAEELELQTGITGLG